MYDIKVVIDNMKKILNITSNIELAKYLNVSYNTLNTWIKRGKIPQEILFGFCINHNVSCDELIMNILQNSNHITIEFIYYGSCKDLNISFKAKLTLINQKLFNNAYYLLKKDNLFFIAKVLFDPFKNKCNIYFNDINYEISFQEFLKLNQGLIIDYK